MKLCLVLLGAVARALLVELNKVRLLRGIQQIKYSKTLFDITDDFFRHQERFKKESAQAIFGPGICFILKIENCNLGTAEESFKRAGLEIETIKHEESPEKTLRAFISTPKGLCMTFSTWFYGCHPWLTGVSRTNGQIHILILSPYDYSDSERTDQKDLRPVDFNPPSCKLKGMEEYEVPDNNAVFSRLYYSINAERVLRGLNPIKYTNIILPSSPAYACPFAYNDPTCREQRNAQMFYYTKVFNLHDKIENLINDFYNPLLQDTISPNSDPKIYFEESGNSLQILFSYQYLNDVNTYRIH